MKLNKAIIKIRVALQNSGLNQSGKNKFAGFSYFELSDFLPSINELMQKEGMNDRFYINENKACLDLILDEEIQTYTIPFTLYLTPTNKSGQPSMQDIQYLGALNTYYKRYLYLNAFGITDGDIIDAMDKTEAPHTKHPMATPEQVKAILELAEVKNADLSKALTVFKVDALEKLTTKQAETMLSGLKKK